MVIVSKNNPLVKELAALKEKKFRKERGAFLVERSEEHTSELQSH